jgi:hypothetical protein
MCVGELRVVEEHTFGCKLEVVEEDGLVDVKCLQVPMLEFTYLGTISKVGGLSNILCSWLWICKLFFL